MTPTKEKVEKIKVKATESFQSHRWITVDGINKEQYRELQAGGIVEIEKKYFNKILFEEVKNGSRK